MWISIGCSPLSSRKGSIVESLSRVLYLHVYEDYLPFVGTSLQVNAKEILFTVVFYCQKSPWLKFCVESRITCTCEKCDDAGQEKEHQHGDTHNLQKPSPFFSSFIGRKRKTPHFFFPPQTSSFCWPWSVASAEKQLRGERRHTKRERERRKQANKRPTSPASNQKNRKEPSKNESKLFFLPKIDVSRICSLWLCVPISPPLCGHKQKIK